MNDHEEYSEASSLPEELIEEIRERLHEGDGEHLPTPEDDVDAPTDPTVYTESDLADEPNASQPGDPGTYTGEYTPAEVDAVTEVVERDDLPEGYVPGAYTGEFRASK